MIVLNIGVFLVVVGVAFLGGFLLGIKKKKNKEKDNTT